MRRRLRRRHLLWSRGPGCISLAYTCAQIQMQQNILSVLSACLCLRTLLNIAFLFIVRMYPQCMSQPIFDLHYPSACLVSNTKTDSVCSDIFISTHRSSRSMFRWRRACRRRPLRRHNLTRPRHHLLFLNYLISVRYFSSRTSL